MPCLTAWAESLGGITYPLLSDFYPHGKVAETFGVLREDGRSERAIFVIDKQGIIRYVDVHDIDSQPDNELLFTVLAEIEPNLPAGKKQSSSEEEPQAEAPQGVQPSSGVIMYCTSWCPACSRARIYLKSHRIEFTEIDITKDREAAARLRAWTNGYETTPTFDINGTIVVNFKTEILDKIFGFEGE